MAPVARPNKANLTMSTGCRQSAGTRDASCQPALGKGLTNLPSIGVGTPSLICRYITMGLNRRGAAFTGLVTPATAYGAVEPSCTGSCSEFMAFVTLEASMVSSLLHTAAKSFMAVQKVSAVSDFCAVGSIASISASNFAIVGSLVWLGGTVTLTAYCLNGIGPSAFKLFGGVGGLGLMNEPPKPDCFSAWSTFNVSLGGASARMPSTPSAAAAAVAVWSAAPVGADTTFTTWTPSSPRRAFASSVCCELVGEADDTIDTRARPRSLASVAIPLAQPNVPATIGNEIGEVKSVGSAPRAPTRGILPASRTAAVFGK